MYKKAKVLAHKLGMKYKNPGDMIRMMNEARMEGESMEHEKNEPKDEDKKEKKHKQMKPKGARGRAAVKRLGRTYKTGGFAKIASKAAQKYGSKEAGKRVAGAIYQRMVKARKG